jgi:chromosome segregation protein
LGLVFAIQDYEPSPFYYLDEVDQNLDPFNAERIATLCRLRSQNAQFIMVTLRKVSLTLADHHIGITHAGDGISRRITDFDRAAALQLGDEFEAEAKAREEAAADKAEMDELPEPEDMPKTPEPLGTPQSLGGLAERAGIEIEGDEDVEDTEDDAADSDVAADDEEIPAIDATAVEAAAELAAEGLESLRERTEEWTEDIAEKEAATPLTEDESAVDPSEPVNGVEVEAEAEAETAPEMEE